MKIYIIRHGQTDWNLLNKIQGSKDIELNKTGIIQAENTIDKFNEYNFDLIICSPLKRAKQTAEIINREKNIPIIYDKSLMERDFGDFEGKQLDIDENLIANLNANLKINNIECAVDFYNRVSKFLDYIKKNFSDKKILLVTHGGTSRAIESYFYGIDENGNMPPMTLNNCEIREYKFKSERRIYYDNN